MSEQTPETATSPESNAPSEPESRNSWAVARRLFTMMYAAAMVVAALGLAFVWQAWDPVQGQGMQNVITYGIVLLSLLLTTGWLMIFSPFRWKTVFAVLGISALFATAVAASVRTFEFTGDMGFVLHYRWEPTADERLAAHLRTVAETAEPIVLDTSADVPAIVPEDIPGYRGDDRSGQIIGPALSQDWETSPPRLLWKQPCGGGYSSFAVVGDFAVTIEQRGEQEAVVCYDGSSGAERWVHEYPASFVEAMGGPGPRATPTIFDGEVYSLGAEGDFVCLDLGTGEPRWHVDALPEGTPNVTWALSSSPLIVENLVIIEAGGPTWGAGENPKEGGLIAYDRSTGDVVWQRPGVDALRSEGGRNAAGYSSPVLTTLHDVRQVVIFDGMGLRGHVPETGDLLWFYEFNTDQRVSVAQPMFLEGGRLFLSLGYGIGSRMIQLTHDAGEWQTETLWENLHMKCKFTSPVLHDGYLYGLDEGILVCLDPETGKRQWKKGRYGHGQILITGGQIVVISERGDVVLVDANPEAFHEVTRFSAIDSPKVWNPHALAGGIVYVRNHETMAAYDLRAE